MECYPKCWGGILVFGFFSSQTDRRYEHGKGNSLAELANK